MDSSSKGWEEKYRALEARVVALSGKEYEISDDKITKQYRAIRDNIDAWIDEVQADENKHFKTTYQKNLQKLGGEDMLDDLGFQGRSMHRGWAEVLGSLKTCVYVVLGKVISEGLRGVFKKQYPLGVTPSQRALLRVGEQATTSSSQPRDPAMYYRWMGETLTYMALTSEFKTQSKKETDTVLKDLKSELSLWLSSKALDRYDTALRDRVVQPAVEFHRMIHCSGKKFDLAYEDRLESPLSTEVMGSDVIDIETWRVSTRKGDIKGVFGCFMPSLIMKIAIGQRDITFVPGVLFGYKTDALNPDKSGRSSPVRQETSDHEHGLPGDGQFNPGQDSRGSVLKSHKLESSSSQWSFSRLLRSSGGRSESRKGSTSVGPSSLLSSANRSRRHEPSGPPRRAHTMPAKTQSSRETTYKMISTTGASPDDRIYVSAEPEPSHIHRADYPAAEFLYDPDSSMEGQDGDNETDAIIEASQTYYEPPPFRYHEDNSPREREHG